MCADTLLSLSLSLSLTLSLSVSLISALSIQVLKVNANIYDVSSITGELCVYKPYSNTCRTNSNNLRTYQCHAPHLGQSRGT